MPPQPQPKNDREPAQLSREDQARLEIGNTEIGPLATWTIALVLLATIAIVPLMQTARDWNAHQSSGSEGSWLQAADIGDALPEAAAAWRETDGGVAQRLSSANRVLLTRIHEYEDTLEQSSFLRERILPPTQLLLARIGAGNEKGYIGRDGWLFFRPAIDLATGPGFLDETRLSQRANGGNEWQSAPAPDPRPAILDFHAQLAERGIQLVLVPTPVKSMIHPEMFRQSGHAGGAALNPSHQTFVREAEAAGILVFDPTEAMIEAKRASVANPSSTAPQFLATDTHWLPDAMERVAKDLAQFLESRLELPASSASFTRTSMQVTATGDIAGMLRLPPDQRLFPPETVTVQQVRTLSGELWTPDPKADALLLGDSFSNIYSLKGMNWGESAGFAEHVSYYLSRPIDAIRRNDSGAFATRQILASERARGHDRLEGKRVVIWQFAARELAVGDWKLIRLPQGIAPATRPTRSTSPEWIATVSGAVVDASEVPGAGVPYKDHIRALHLSGLETLSGVNSEPEAVVYVWDMRDRELTPEARLRTDDRVTLRVRPWDDVSDTLGRINRSELDDPDLLFLPTWWGERTQD